MSRRAKFLDREPDEIEAALRHPFQLQVYGWIRDLIAQLRDLGSLLKSPGDYYEYQRLIFSYLLVAEQYQATASRNVKRARAGKPVPATQSGSWELELYVGDRVVRQLRSVGDALAWRCFGFDRRFILALSANERAGPMVGKAGLERELGEVVEIWRRERSFALLHDLTSVLRIADVTKFTKQRPELVEVKAGKKGIPAAQMSRIQRAMDVINEGAPLPGQNGDSSLFVSSIQFKTHLKALAHALALADEQGVASVGVSRKWVVTCMSLTSPALPYSFDEAIGTWNRKRSRAFSKAGLAVPRQHHLRGVYGDEVTANRAAAPFAIFPFGADACARLTCDFLAYENVLAWDRMAQEFEAEGFSTTCPLPDASERVRPGQPILIAQKGDFGLTVHSGGFHQVLFEFVEPSRYVSAVSEFLHRYRKPGSGVFTFSNERAVWK